MASTSKQLALSLPPPPDLVRDFIEQTDDSKSNTVELFDALVVYSPERARETDTYLTAQKTVRGKTVRVVVTPAALPGRGGKISNVLPGRRENLVEKALRKIATEDVWAFSYGKDNAGEAEAGVYFTKHHLRMVLSEEGHDFTIKQLDEALAVLAGTRLQIEGDITPDFTKMNNGIGFIREYTTCVPKHGDPEGRKQYVHVKFHPLVTRSLIQKTFRRIDFKKLMRPKSELARWLYCRLSHNYTQAKDNDLVGHMMGEQKGYHIALTTIIREYALNCADLRFGARAVRSALDVMREHSILRNTTWTGAAFPGYTEKISYGEKAGRGRRPIVDIVWTLFPSTEVVDDIVSANKAAVAMLARPPAGVECTK